MGNANNTLKKLLAIQKRENAETGNVLMTSLDWKAVHNNFSMTERWGDPWKMRKDFVFLLDSFRNYIATPFVINCGYATKGHSAKSQHYLGRAVDGYAKGMSLLQLFLAALRFFNGIGIYPDWKTPGLHLDNRVLPPNAPRVLWYCKNGKYVYTIDDNFIHKIQADYWLKLKAPKL